MLDSKTLSKSLLSFVNIGEPKQAAPLATYSLLMEHNGSEGKTNIHGSDLPKNDGTFAGKFPYQSDYKTVTVYANDPEEAKRNAEFRYPGYHVSDVRPPEVMGGTKQANAFTQVDELPVDSVNLQAIIGDPDTNPLSWSAQFKPSEGNTLQYDPNSPMEGDEIFFSGLFDGARFQDKNGEWWDILEYDWEGSVQIQKTWYPRVVGVVSIQDVRRSIHSWIQPFLQRVPPMPAGVDYGVVETRQVQ